ncbi:hypothetical protein V2J09_019820 [Rumex salicifolius]
MNFFYYALALAILTPAVSGASQHHTATSGQLAVKVGVVMGDMDALPENTTWPSLQMALSEFYAAHPNYTTRLFLHRRFSPSRDILSSASAGYHIYCNL